MAYADNTEKFKEACKILYAKNSEEASRINYVNDPEKFKAGS